MAQNLQLLKRRIKTSKNIAQIAKALEMIAASKIKKGQNASLNNRPYTDKITTLTGTAIKKVDKTIFSHPYTDKKTSSKTLLIVISPDRGLCGSLNTNIFKKMMEIKDASTKVVTIGKKAGQFAAKLKFDLIASYPFGSTLPSYSLVFQLKKIIDEELEKGSIGDVKIIYSDFQSIFLQIPTLKQLLPISLEVDTDKKDNESIFEPSNEDVLDDLLPYYLEVQLYNALLQAFTSAQAAQMVAMQNAKNNAIDIAEYFNLVYNRSRQERITNEILDLSNSKII